ncbi:hypothetical protein GCM10027343_25290 [Noviherbaspirillum agri]
MRNVPHAPNLHSHRNLISQVPASGLSRAVATALGYFSPKVDKEASLLLPCSFYLYFPKKKSKKLRF